ncbi:MAG TPA: hypothetical protein DF480_05990 [Clostridiales bacterium]|nr:hypothetical protein [Clostridiales bacterium]
MEHHKLFRIPDGGRNRIMDPFVKENRKIAITGPGRGSGVSLTAGLLAAWIRHHAPSEAVALAELGTAYFYEAYGVEKRFIHRDFHSFYQLMAQKRNIKNVSNTEEGINWVLHCPQDSFEQQIEWVPCVSDMLRLIHNISGTLCLFDCSGVPSTVLWEVLPEMDAVICVLDPLPSSLIPATADIERMRLAVPDTVWMVNKMNRGVHKGELKRFLGNVEWVEMPCLPLEDLYRAQYNCVLPYSVLPVRQKTEESLKALWTQLGSLT